MILTFKPFSPKYACENCNVILISIDTLRADHLGIYGYSLNTSPNIDKLATNSFVFMNIKTQAPYTLPAHMSLFTSLYPSVHLVGEFDDNTSLNPNIKTLTQIFKNNGYYTAGFIDAPYVDSFYGFSRGFDFFDERSVLNGDGGIANINQRVYHLLENLKSKKFFLFLHYMDVHSPYDPPEEYIKVFDWNYSGPVNLTQNYEDQLIRMNLTNDDWNYIKAGYDGSILYTDSYLGKLFSKIDEIGLRNNTVIIILSDHGEELNDHHSLGHGRTLFEEILHVPLIISVPNIYSGEIINQSGEIIDVAPTLLKLIGINIPSQFQGIDILNSADTNRLIYSEKAMANLTSIQDNDMKFIYNSTSDKIQQFELSSDSREQTNIFRDAEKSYFLSKISEFKQMNTVKEQSLDLYFFSKNITEILLSPVTNFNMTKAAVIRRLEISPINQTWSTNGYLSDSGIIIAPKSSFEPGYVNTKILLPNSSVVLYVNYSVVKSLNDCSCSNILLRAGMVRNSTEIVLFKYLVDYNEGYKSTILDLSPFAGKNIDFFIHAEVGDCPGWCGFPQLKLSDLFFAIYTGNLSTIQSLNKEALQKLGYVT
jgi:arylsulfatase A-like enzyme